MKKIVILLLAVLLTAPGIGCRGGSKAAQQALVQPITLDWWRVFDGFDTTRGVIDAYNALHPNIGINYRRLRFEEYEDELIQAFAEGRGPDILSIHNTWIPKYQTLTQPLPKSLQIVYLETRGSLKKEVIPTIRETPSLTLRQLQTQFVDVVAEDVVRPYQETPRGETEERIWGLPASVDTLTMFYNRDLLNAANIPEPPTNWREFQNQVKSLTRIDGQNNIVQAGASIGGSTNIERSVDLLSVIMMQNGTQMSDPGSGRATFAETPPGGARGDLPGLTALQFYTDFSNPLKEVYTWNEDQPNSFDVFANGTSAFFFGYSYHVSLLKARNPKLNFAVTKLPQISGGRIVNSANYWVETVAKDSDNPNEAWDFIQFLTTEDDAVSMYLDAAKRPTARRSLINSQIEDIDLNPFVSQILTAKSWYRGRNVDAAEAAIHDLIDNALTATKLEDELSIAQNKVNQTL